MLGCVFGLCCWAIGLCFSELGADGGLLTSVDRGGGEIMQSCFFSQVDVVLLC